MKYIKKFESFDIKVDRPEGESKKVIDELLEDINDIIQPIKDKSMEVVFDDHFIPASRAANDDWNYFLKISISDDDHLKEDRDMIEVVGDIMRYCDNNLAEYGFKCEVKTYYWDYLSQLTEMTKVVDPEELFKIDSWADRTVKHIDVINIRIIRD
jgi:hypothetical protein